MLVAAGEDDGVCRAGEAAGDAGARRISSAATRIRLRRAERNAITLVRFAE